MRCLAFIKQEDDIPITENIIQFLFSLYRFPVDDTIDLSQPIKFDGRTYHKYPNRVGFREKAQVNNKIEVRIKTKESDGLILLIHKPSTLQVTILTLQSFFIKIHKYIFWWIPLKNNRRVFCCRIESAEHVHIIPKHSFNLTLLCSSG